MYNKHHINLLLSWNYLLSRSLTNIIILFLKVFKIHRSSMEYILPCRRSNIPGVPYQLTPALLHSRPKGFQVDCSLSWILSPGNRFCGRPSPRVLATPWSSLKKKHTQRIRYSRRSTRYLIKLPINRISIFL